MSKPACWTCKDRRIRCDRSIPTCKNCVRSHRKCQGYGMRLSWPQERDRRRTLHGPKPPALVGARHIKPFRWVNAGFRDIELYHHLSATSFMEGRAKSRFVLPTLSASITWVPSRLDKPESSLLEYFESIAHHTLTTCDDDLHRLLGDLSRLALSDATESSTAVLLALLALASIHRHGPQPEAMRLQGRALRALESSAQKGMTDSEAIQHIAAGMLLCSFEVQGVSHKSGSGPWLWYVGGARRLIRAIKPKKETLPGEFFTMLNWVHYHDVMGRFSLRHWRPYQQPAPWELSHPLGPTVNNIARITGTSSCSLTLMRPVSEVFENLVAPSNPLYHCAEYRSYLASLEHRLENLKPGSGYTNTVTHRGLAASGGECIFDLFRLAALVYLERAAMNFSGESPKVNAWTDRAFGILEKMPACRHAFPLLIFGCEARTDQRRIVILDAIEQAIKRTHSRNLQSVLGDLQSVWNQDDLNVERDTDYSLKLSVILSSYDTVPCFA